MRRHLLGAGFTLAAMLSMAGIARAQPAGEIRIALAGPLTGDQATIGEQMRRGAEMAVADLNAAGGVLGRRVVLQMEDDACDPRQAVAVANRIVGRNVSFVVGHYCSATSIAASDVYADAGIPQVSPGSTNPRYTERGLGNVFRVCGRDDQQAQVAAAYVARRFPGQPVGITNDLTAPGVTLADVFQSQLRSAGMQEAVRAQVTKGETDFNAVVTRLKSAGVRVLFHSAYHREAALILRQAKEQGLDLQLISNDDLNVRDFWGITGPAGEGSLFTFEADPRRTPAGADIARRFEAANFDPSGYTLYSYAAVQIFAQAATSANNAQPARILAAMKGREFNTALGPIRFDAKGDREGAAYRVYAWRDGRIAEAE
ncbi:branched-chain amino acid ABC transporter substrate-binding protein [Roseomonas sp. SSH11]|uniref:Branched-chain amino acid ABC transporter substrate-binding protein n=1 Tax=Pararoseomonas baculiformis TaxID=2820812 RepID=A0ABS4AA45_9PROT|nr:branched-chain amino acid ABC transporter substrate-binding protein [Pararoseomonas baculiformis]MBP0443726.1 branched-chain amino acid ABC transporter substrate-binding protein [Pararoseomonas baculiformis]